MVVSWPDSPITPDGYSLERRRRRRKERRGRRDEKGGCKRERERNENRWRTGEKIDETLTLMLMAVIAIF